MINKYWDWSFIFFSNLKFKWRQVFSWAIHIIRKLWCQDYCLDKSEVIWKKNHEAHFNCFWRKIFLAKHMFVQVQHLPYSPDLRVCNFFLFLKCKEPNLVWPKNMLTASLQGVKTSSPMNVLNRTLKRDGESPVLRNVAYSLHCHYSQFHFDLVWLYLLGSSLWVK